jgi:nicotinamidase-related amidase
MTNRSPPLLVCLDLQRAFTRQGPLHTPHAPAALMHCRRVLSAARARRWRVVHCYLKRQAGPLYFAPEDGRPIEGFEPLRLEPVLEREPLSAYGHDAFNGLMESAADTGVLMIGLSASLTFVATAIDAFERGHTFVIAAEALAGQQGGEASAQQHESVARDIAAHLGFESASIGDSGIEKWRKDAVPPLVIGSGR